MKQELPILSAELFTIPVGDAFLVYAPLRQVAFIANAKVINALADIQERKLDSIEPEVGSLLELLRHLGIVDGGNEVRPARTHSGNPNPTSVTLFLTTSCNLRCSYCYASAGDTPAKRMPLEVAIRGIDFIVANAIKTDAAEIEVNFHGGGEPTLNWSTLTGAFDYAQNRCHESHLALRAAMASNGVLTDKKIDWMVEHLDGVSLSFDGSPDVHDVHRPTVGGRPSSAAVMHTMKRFDEAEFKYGVRMTVTREQISRIAESVRFVCQNFHPQRIQIEPAYQLGRWRDEASAETEEFISGFRAAQQIAKQHGRYLEFSGARVGTITNHFCGITQDSFCLTADGSVSACYEVFLEGSEFSDTFHYGKYDAKKESFVFNLPVLNNLREKTVDARPFCEGCFAKWSCGGDCYHKALSVNGLGEFAGTDRCHIIRELTKDQLLEQILASGGLFWRGEALSSEPETRTS